MALMRFDPFRGGDAFPEMSMLQREMNRLFDRMITDDDDNKSGDIGGYSFIPAAEIHDSPEQIKLRIEVPGIEAKDLDVKVTSEAVAITGERKQESQHEDKGMRRSEFRYGRFQRVIPLPTRIQNDKVQAEFQNGVLCLTLPKAEEERNKVVTVSLQGQTNQQATNGQQSIPTYQQTQPNGQMQTANAS